MGIKIETFLKDDKTHTKLDWKSFYSDVNTSLPKIFNYILDNCGSSTASSKFCTLK